MNPRMVERLRRTLLANRITDVQIRHAALSDREGRAELREFDAHAGWGTIAAAGPDGATQTASWSVPCHRGDALLALPDGPLVLKIDVEGHEAKVLRGLEATIAHRKPLVFVEVVDRHQRQDGSSAAELCGELERHGYRGYVLEGRRRLLLRHDVVLRPLAPDETRDVDVLFVPPDGPLAERIAPLLA
jgi:FkbM family methyltransferase